MQQKGILFWTIIRRQVSRDLWLLRPSPVIAQWVDYQQKPSSELGMNLPRDKMVMKCPPKYGQIYDHKGAMSTINWHLPRALPTPDNKGICHLPLCRLNPMLLWLLTSHTHWGSSGWREALCAPGIWWDSSLDSWMFLGTDFMISILTSPHI